MVSAVIGIVPGATKLFEPKSKFILNAGIVGKVSSNLTRALVALRIGSWIDGESRENSMGILNEELVAELRKKRRVEFFSSSSRSLRIRSAA